MQSEGAMNAMLAQAEDVLSTMEYLVEGIEREMLDSVQWFLLSGLLHDMASRLARVRMALDKSRPAAPIRQLLVESLSKVVSA